MLKIYSVITLALAFLTTSAVEANQTTRTVSLSPSTVSICNLTRDSSDLKYNQIIKVVNQDGNSILAVADLNTLNDRANAPSYLSLWSVDRIVLSPRLIPHDLSKVFIKINQKMIPLDVNTNVDRTCQYGNRVVTAYFKPANVHGILDTETVDLQLSKVAKEALKRAGKDDKISIVYRTANSFDDVEQETEFTIDRKTISSWQKINTMDNK
jgi:hypothetical protein